MTLYNVPIKRTILEVWTVEAKNPSEAAIKIGAQLVSGGKPTQTKEIGFSVLAPQKMAVDPSDQVQHAQDDQQDDDGQHSTEPVVAHERTVDAHKLAAEDREQGEARLLTPPRKKP